MSWHAIADSDRQCCLQINLALVGLLNVSLALEDPFDNQGLDGIYIDEALFEAEQVSATPPFIFLSCTVHLLLRRFLARRQSWCRLHDAAHSTVQCGLVQLLQASWHHGGRQHASLPATLQLAYPAPLTHRTSEASLIIQIQSSSRDSCRMPLCLMPMSLTHGIIEALTEHANFVT